MYECWSKINFKHLKFAQVPLKYSVYNLALTLNLNMRGKVNKPITQNGVQTYSAAQFVQSADPNSSVGKKSKTQV